MQSLTEESGYGRLAPNGLRKRNVLHLANCHAAIHYVEPLGSPSAGSVVYLRLLDIRGAVIDVKRRTRIPSLSAARSS